MKRISLLLIIILVILLTACGSLKDAALPEAIQGDKADIHGEKEEVLSLDDYFPFLENTVLEYENPENEMDGKLYYFEYISGNRAQMKMVNLGTNILMVIENKNGVVKEVYTEGEFYHIENLLNVESSTEDILLKEPLEVGNSWETVNGEKREITGVNVDIETPYKTFNSIEVTTFKKDGTSIDYFAPGVGLVASLHKDNHNEVKYLLKTIKEETRKIYIEKYYPIDLDSDLVYVYDEIDFKTNGKLEELIEDVLKNPSNKKLIPLISPKTKLNSLKLDRNNWKLRADFSPDLISDMNYGGAMENKILLGIVNTLGRFYDVDGITITIDGRAYESGHFYFKEDEVLNVNIEGMEEFIP